MKNHNHSSLTHMINDYGRACQHIVDSYARLEQSSIFQLLRTSAMIEQMVPVSQSACFMDTKQNQKIVSNNSHTQTEKTAKKQVRRSSENNINKQESGKCKSLLWKRVNQLAQNTISYKKFVQQWDQIQQECLDYLEDLPNLINGSQQHENGDENQKKQDETQSTVHKFKTRDKQQTPLDMVTEKKQRSNVFHGYSNSVAISYTPFTSNNVQNAPHKTKNINYNVQQLHLGSDQV